MIRLGFLGGFAIAEGDRHRPEWTARRRAIAVLALASGEHGISRDRVLALLWPELDSAHARNNLKQVVFTLRNSLGPDIFVAHGTMLILNPAAVTVDIRAFQHLLDAGDLVNAVELYAGPLLDGFHLGDLPAFDEWLERARAALERRYTAALERLAQQAVAAGDGRSAVELFRRLTERDPLRADYGLALMQAFVDLGEPMSALHSAQTHERAVRRELQADPDPRVKLLAERVRASLAPQNDAAVPGPTDRGVIARLSPARAVVRVNHL